MKPSRRKFIKNIGGVAALSGISTIAKPFNIIKSLNISPNDKIRIATIGMGIQGNYDTKAALKNEGIEFVAAADLYTGRLERVKQTFGNEVFTTRDYREILQRKDIDAVLVVTPDHWHDKIAIEALNAGKNVYCEKPMVQAINEGLPVINAWKKSGKTMQVGSQRISGSVFQEAKKIIAAGDIGAINYIESNNDRFSAIGAWNYSIPTDASPSTVDWDTFLKDTAKMPFDANRFFRWRNYKNYGTGVAGDLFVHLITGVHYVVDSKGPNRIYASGGLRYWKEGRDVPDVMVAILDYPKDQTHDEFQMVLRVNFANAGTINNNTRIIGTEGQIDFSGNGLTLSKKKLPKAPGFGNYDSYFTFSEAQQKEFEKEYNARYSEADKVGEPVKEIKFTATPGDDEHKNHFANFFENVRKGSQGTIEDPVFGFRAAAPVLACNESYFQKKTINWDPVGMKKV
ncbi:gfo/Idh/MocA family oxidoreductase [Lacihabitans sp. LS3-19]|uniref:Gfo/Idh/MocA family protein n=1 Tax=Lacihabitans sp. LS3-19 TaxID=2487335 RepID=UPI0020CC8597|nr:Gfo/Idh/MocA family oxidoreductase [Lacihabitans sp. LS3-19]MCP9770662.1 gfo/Idh/MocA family oxidoreductase [Lacihabitans sp. LS3-19]